MSFSVNRNYTPVILMSIVLLASGSYYLVNKAQNEKRERAEQLAAQAAKTKEHDQKLAEQRKKDLAEKAEELAALEAHKLSEREAKAVAERERLAQKLADRLEAERHLMEKKQAERELAWKRYAGTKYPELKASGKNYKDVTVLTASSSGITFSYEHGARKYSYEHLPIEIQEICMYDPDFTDSYIAMKEKQRATNPATRVLRKTQATKNEIITPVAQVKVRKTDAVVIKGRLSVRLIDSLNNKSKTYRSGSKYYRTHYKILQITAVSSVPAKIYNNSSLVKSIPAMTKVEFTFRTPSNGKYSLELRDESGRVLDREGWNRNSSLDGATGL